MNKELGWRGGEARGQIGLLRAPQRHQVWSAAHARHADGGEAAVRFAETMKFAGETIEEQTTQVGGNARPLPAHAQPLSCQPRGGNLRPWRCTSSPRSPSYSGAIVNRNIGFGTEKLALERGTNPKLSRRMCTCEYGLQSCRGKSAGVAKRPRELSPSEIPHVNDLQPFQVMTNMGEVLKAAGCDFSHVVKTTILLAEMSDFAAVNKIYATYFDAAPPARATFAVKDLPLGALVEIDCTAVQ